MGSALRLAPNDNVCINSNVSLRHAGEFTEEELDGFTSTPSGLKYKDVVLGDGGMPSKGNAIQTHYSGNSCKTVLPLIPRVEYDGLN